MNMSKEIVASSPLVSKSKSEDKAWVKQLLRRLPMGDNNKRIKCQEIIITKYYCCKLTQVGDSEGDSSLKELGKFLAFIRGFRHKALTVYQKHSSLLI